MIYQHDLLGHFREAEMSEGQGVDRIEGTLVYIKGHEFPLKSLPTPEAVMSIGIMKTILTSMIRLAPCLIFVPFKTIVEVFNKIGWKVMGGFILKREYQTKATQTIRDITALYLTRLGIEEDQACQFADTFSHIFEYDSAYRIRIQDLANETTTKELLKNPRKEILRLLKLNESRDYDTVRRKFRIVANLVGVILLIPKYKRAFKETIQAVGIEGLYFDEIDLYWAKQRRDYKANVNTTKV